MWFSSSKRKHCESLERGHYVPLALERGRSPSEGRDGEPKREIDDQTPHTLKYLCTRNLVACVVALLSTFANLYFSFNPPTGNPATQSHSPTKLLRRPTQFISLSSISYPSNRHLYSHFSNATLDVFPTVVQHISRTVPERVFYNESADPRRRFTRFGTISPEDRRVVVSADNMGPDVSTILQFRARDYGMERCQLRLFLDSKHKYKTEGNHNADTRRKDWILSGDTSKLQIWKLDTPLDPTIEEALAELVGKPGYEPYKFGRIDPKSLSFSNRPTQERLLANFNLTHIQEGHIHALDGILETPEFDCPEDSILTFELACVSPGCFADWWQDRRMPIGAGIVLHQRSTL